MTPASSDADGLIGKAKMVSLVRYRVARARFRLAMIVATWAAREIERTIRP